MIFRLKYSNAPDIHRGFSENAMVDETRGYVLWCRVYIIWMAMVFLFDVHWWHQGPIAGQPARVARGPGGIRDEAPCIRRGPSTISLHVRCFFFNDHWLIGVMMIECCCCCCCGGDDEWWLNPPFLVSHHKPSCSHHSLLSSSPYHNLDPRPYDIAQRTAREGKLDERLLEAAPLNWWVIDGY